MSRLELGIPQLGPSPALQSNIRIGQCMCTPGPRHERPIYVDVIKGVAICEAFYTNPYLLRVKVPGAVFQMDGFLICPFFVLQLPVLETSLSRQYPLGCLLMDSSHSSTQQRNLSSTLRTHRLLFFFPSIMKLSALNYSLEKLKYRNSQIAYLYLMA